MTCADVVNIVWVSDGKKVEDNIFIYSIS